MKYTKTIGIALLSLFLLSTAASCVRSSKTCKKNAKKVRSMRKSGELKM